MDYESYKTKIERLTQEAKERFSEYKSLYPNLLREIPFEHYYMVSVEKGWEKLIKAVLEALEPQCEGFYITQIKEKFGVLCIYFQTVQVQDDPVVNINGNFLSLYEFIQTAENLSKMVCQTCGSFKFVETESFSGRIMTLCPKCRDNINND